MISLIKSLLAQKFTLLSFIEKVMDYISLYGHLMYRVNPSFICKLNIKGSNLLTDHSINHKDKMPSLQHLAYIQILATAEAPQTVTENYDLKVQLRCHTLDQILFFFFTEKDSLEYFYLFRLKPLFQL